MTRTIISARFCMWSFTRMYRRIPSYPSSESWRWASRAIICATTSLADGDLCAPAKKQRIRDKIGSVIKKRNRMLELQNEFPAVFPPGVVEKSAELRAG